MYQHCLLSFLLLLSSNLVLQLADAVKFQSRSANDSVSSKARNNNVIMAEGGCNSAEARSSICGCI